ncbi:MAG: ribonuclease P protein component [Flavobacteriales bacterium]|jgi:ribonuclease P protein component|nr:ribonuclease P protein component [Flavobacteriales bacterium]MCB0757624.1 ribonuclease P protein component [Flavobacteriales bacterium]
MTGQQPLRATFRKHERLTGRDRLREVATTGQVVKDHPFRLVGLLMPLDTIAPAQVAFAVPKRHVKLAVDRNRVRRHMREAYRLNKHRWYERLRAADVQCAWLLIFQGTAPLPWERSSEKIINLFDRWTQQHVGIDR